MDITKSQLRPKLGWQADRPQQYIGKRRGSWGGIVWSKWLSIITCSVANHVVKQIQWRIYLCPHLEVIILVESLCNMRKQQLLGVLFRIVSKGIQLKYLFDLIDTSRAEGVGSRTTYTQTKWASPPSFTERSPDTLELIIWPSLTPINTFSKFKWKHPWKRVTTNTSM